MKKNSQTDAPDLPPGLYVVATPIGNLRDITQRALDILHGANLIACEDTRVTSKLLTHYGITTRCVAYHDHNERDKTPELIDVLQEGGRIALVSDAGTPLLSDPGYVLVSEAKKRGLNVVPIPGASAIITALCASGLPAEPFFFAGFLPAKPHAREKAILDLKPLHATIVLLESVHRLQASLDALAAQMGQRQAVIARELTKRHEEIRKASLQDLATYYRDQGVVKGEMVIVIAPPDAQESSDQASLSDEAMDQAIRDALQTMRVTEAAAFLAREWNLPRKQIYERALAIQHANSPKA